MIQKIIELINVKGRQGPKDVISKEVYDWIKNEISLSYEKYVDLIKSHTIPNTDRSYNRNAYFVQSKKGKVTLFKSNELEIRKYICYIVRNNPGITSGETRVKLKLLYPEFTIVDLMDQKNLSSKQDIIDQTIRNVMVSNYDRTSNTAILNKSETKPYTYTIKDEGLISASIAEEILINNQRIAQEEEQENIVNKKLPIYSDEELKEINLKNKTFNLLDKYADLDKHKGRFPTDVKIKNTRFHQTNCKCEIDENHITFPTPVLSNFVEGHHIVPMNAQKNFLKKNLDCIQNMSSLCPICHSKLTSGTKEIKEEVFNKLIEKREKDLLEIGFTKEIMNTIFELYYNI